LTTFARFKVQVSDNKVGVDVVGRVGGERQMVEFSRNSDIVSLGFSVSVVVVSITLEFSSSEVISVETGFPDNSGIRVRISIVMSVKRIETDYSIEVTSII